MKDTKFIIVKDEDTANKLISNGFQMISKTNDVYTFMNIIPQHFKFDEININKLAYTNILHI